MDNQKKAFSDYVDMFQEHVVDNREAFIVGEEESEKVLQSKLAKNVDFAKKIEERLEKRSEKHEETVAKSLLTFEDKLEKNKLHHTDKLQQIEDKHQKQKEAYTQKIEKEKSKFENSLFRLENKYSKEEKKCLSTIQKAQKKAESYKVDSIVSKTERDGQNSLKILQKKLKDSHNYTYDYSEKITSIINQIKDNQFELETLQVEYDLRNQKLKDRKHQEELNHEAIMVNHEETAKRDELKLRYDLDRITLNYEYNIINETLTTQNRIEELEYTMQIEEEEFRYFESDQELKYSRKDQLEKERVELETILQKDNIDNVKNNFALSNKEHKNLLIYETALHSAITERNKTLAKISQDEIDVRTKELLEKTKIAIEELQTDLQSLVEKVKANLKTELIMPTKQIKQVESKYKVDQKEITKVYQASLKTIDDELTVLDPSFDSDNIHDLQATKADLIERYKSDIAHLENDLNMKLAAYNKKIENAKNRSEDIINHAQFLYDQQLEIYQNEITRINKQAEEEKQQAKNLQDKIQEQQDRFLDFISKTNSLANNQNDETQNDLLDLFESNIAYTSTQQEVRYQRNKSLFEQRIAERKHKLDKNSANYKKEIKNLENKLLVYEANITKKLDLEQKDLERRIKKINLRLKNDQVKEEKRYQRIMNSYSKAMIDAEHKYLKDSKPLLQERDRYLQNLQEAEQEEKVEVSLSRIDIFYEE